jgi:hypothetical protein
MPNERRSEFCANLEVPCCPLNFHVPGHGKVSLLGSDRGRDFLDDQIFFLGITVLPNRPNRAQIRAIFSQFQEPSSLGPDQDSDPLTVRYSITLINVKDQLHTFNATATFGDPKK